MAFRFKECAFKDARPSIEVYDEDGRIVGRFYNAADFEAFKAGQPGASFFNVAG